MSGVSGSGVSGASEAPLNVSVLAELLQGQTGLAASIAAYQEAKSASVAALEELRLGKAAVVALEEAKQKHQQAQDVLDKAQRDAKRIVDEAETKAASIVSDAGRQRAGVLADIEASRKTHLDWVEKTKTEAEEKRKDAAAVFADAKKLQAAHETALAVANSMTEAAKKAKKDAEDLQKSLQERSEKLRSAIAGI